MMSPSFTPEYFFNVIAAHLARRDDFWHVVNGPKREVWFVSEAIAALSRSSADNLATGHRVYGEETYSKLVENFGGDKALLTKENRSRLPDITIATNYASHLVAVVDAKLCDDFEPKNLDAAEGQLQYQLDMSRRVLPSVPVLGVIFAVHHLERAVQGAHVAVAPQRFYEHVSEHAERAMDFNTYEWCFQDRIVPVHGLQRVKPLGGMFASEASLGIGLIHPRGQQYR